MMRTDEVLDLQVKPAYLVLDAFHHGQVEGQLSVTKIMADSEYLRECQDLFELYVSDYIMLMRCKVPNIADWLLLMLLIAECVLVLWASLNCDNNLLVSVVVTLRNMCKHMCSSSVILMANGRPQLRYELLAPDMYGCIAGGTGLPQGSVGHGWCCHVYLHRLVCNPVG